jgi:hypothetical protein
MRTIVEEQIVQEKIDSARKKFKRLDDIYNGLSWRLSREPESGVSIGKRSPNIFLAKIDPAGDVDLPGILVIYSYNDDHVNILDMRIDAPASAKKKPQK